MLREPCHHGACAGLGERLVIGIAAAARVSVTGRGAISTISTPALSGSPVPSNAHASTPSLA
jgi:hypothetical protein